MVRLGVVLFENIVCETEWRILSHPICHNSQSRPYSTTLLRTLATWCGPCQMMAPQLEAAAAELGDRCRVGKIDSDKQNFTEENFKSGFHVGAGFSMFLLDVILYYNFN